MENSIKVVFVCVRCVVIFPPFLLWRCWCVIGGEEAEQEEANTLELKPERHGRHVRIMLGPPM